MVVGSSTRRWDVRRRAKHARLEGTRKALGLSGKVIPTNKIGMAIDTLVMPGDRVVLEGNNQKQADFLSRALVNVDSERIHDLHMIMPSVSLPEHMDLFEKGIAKRLDFSYAGSQSLRIAQLLEDGQLEIGAIHTYVELYSRLYVDLIPNVVLVAAYAADREGNLYTGPSTEDTPALLEAAAFHDGVVIAQVNEIVDDPKDLKRVDIPGSWVDYVVKADRPFFIEPLFTRSAPDQGRTHPDGHDGFEGDLRTARSRIFESRHRLQHCCRRIASSNIRRRARHQRQGMPSLVFESASDADPRH